MPEVFHRFFVVLSGMWWSRGSFADVLSTREACFKSADAQVLRAPDKHDFHPTTSWSFKRDLAMFFCEKSSATLTVLELGVFRGYTTAVLSAVFGRVLAADVENDYLEQSADYNRGRQNVVYFNFDSYSDDWQLFRSNAIDVVFIDADHSYEKVHMDAINALSQLKPVSYLVFDDFGMEIDVRRVVQELQEAGVLRDCEFLGLGKDGQPWELRDYDTINASEGIVCQRGRSVLDFPPNLDAHPFLLYHVNPEDPLVRAQGWLSFRANGILWTNPWGAGTWWTSQYSRPKKLALNISLPLLAPGNWEAAFNRPLSAFFLTPTANPFDYARWLGLRSEKLNHLFRIANEQFDEQ